MNRDNQNEIWQVEVGGQIYEASLSELPEWIEEGSLQPGDKVRKGNLRWVEARRVPTLIPFFSAKANGEPIPLIQTVNDGASRPENGHHQITPRPTSANSELVEGSLSAGTMGTDAAVAVRTSGNCARHADRPSSYHCTICGLEFCKACPTSYGGNVRICPDCGSMCRSDAESRKTAEREAVEIGIGSEAFGFSDLARALSYPFRFKTSLIVGGLFFMAFTFAQKAANVGGLFLSGAAIVAFMLANMLVFGVRANLIDNFVQGRLDVDFMPSFDDFTLWDDVLHPFFLYIAAVLSSFGPFLLIFVVGAYLVLSAASDQMTRFNHELTSVPGTQAYAPDRTAEQSEEVRKLLEVMKQQNERQIAERERATQSSVIGAETGEPSVGIVPPSVPDGEKMESLMREIRAKQSARDTSVHQDAGSEYWTLLTSIARLAAPLVVLGFLAFLWGLFYYPAACAVAGYSRSFRATLNPAVGLDTMRRLGVSYLLILVMAAILGAGFLTVDATLKAVFSPLDLPGMGNIPATVIGSFISFYFSVVFSCILGYALFKAAEKLKLSR